MKGKTCALIVIAVMVLSALAGPAVAQEEESPRTGIRPDAPPYGVRGPHPVGTMEFVIEDEERPLPVTVWYPALNPEGVEEAATYAIGFGEIAPPMDVAGHAISDAAPDAIDGPYPLVVYSHGLGASRYISLFFTEHMASYGFVVMAPNHTNNTFAELYEGFFGGDEAWGVFQERVMNSFIERPLDVSHVIDLAEILSTDDGALPGMVDTEKVAISGWSFGGYAAFAAAGAQMELDNEIRDVCAETPEVDGFCWVLEPDWEAFLIEAQDADIEPRGLWPSLGDERVDAVVGLAPWIIALSNEGLAEVTVPTMMIFGSGDWDTLPEHNALRAYQHVSSADKAAVTLEHAFHGIFANKCTDRFWAEDWGPYCSDWVWDMDRAHDLINHFTTAFLLSVLYDDAEAAAALAPDAVDFPGILYETTMGQ